MFAVRVVRPVTFPFWATLYNYHHPRFKALLLSGSEPVAQRWEYCCSVILHSLKSASGKLTQGAQTHPSKSVIHS